MISLAILAVGRMLVMGLGTMQPSVATPVSPAAVPAPAAIVAAAPAATTSAVRDYASIAHLDQTQSLPSTGIGNGGLTLTAEEEALFDQTNQDREAEGLGDLQLDPLLCAVARSHSQDMSQRSYFDHMAPVPGPVSPMDRYLSALGFRPDYAFLGENIYFRSETDSTTVSAAEANTAFMHSDGHRANILQPKFTKMGIGFYRDPQTGAFWVTEMFLRDQE